MVDSPSQPPADQSVQSRDAHLFHRFGREVPSATVIFREGERGDSMFVIQSGRVRITKTVRSVDRVLDILGPGEFFGEMAVLNARPRTATATAIEDTKLLVVDTKTLEAMVRGNIEIAVRMIKKLAARLEEADRQIENLMLKDQASRVVHCIAGLAETEGTIADDGIHVNVASDGVAEMVSFPTGTVDEMFARLERARLVFRDAAGGGFIVRDAAGLRKFLELLGVGARGEPS